MQKKHMFLMFMLLGPMWSNAQETAFERGRTFWAAQKWKEAAAEFAAAVGKDVKNGQAWFWLGVSRNKTGEHEKAIEALKKADELGVNRPFARFAIARSLAATMRTEEAFTWLDKAVDAGFNVRTQMENEEAFNALRDDVRMKAILERIEKNIRPADFDARYRQFDFWIGEWNVYDPGGNLQGTNTITKDLGGAVLIERWTNAFGISGMSINFFDPGSGTFKQQWVSQSGYNTSYEGTLVDGSMVMIGVNADIKGVVSKNRMTFTPNPDGTVTQFIEAYDDSTGTWNHSFQGTYKKRGSR